MMQPVMNTMILKVFLWSGVVLVAKRGPFAYDGLISFWFAVFVFFGWMVVMTVTTFQAVSREEGRES
ncbi:MAG: hypothetical protein OXC05_06885 [Halieaceae bacterium]|nr:hypothetical protein [Halieaceae bacterium]